MLKKLATRIRNPKVITGVCGGILLILVNCGLIDNHMSDNITKGVNTVLSLLVGMGIFADPNSHVSKKD